MTDKRTERLKARRNERRLDRLAAMQQQAAEAKQRRVDQREQMRLNAEIREEQRKLSEEKRQDRRERWAGVTNRVRAVAPVIGTRTLTWVPILSPMAVAWVGQIKFATTTLAWPLAAAFVFAAAWEATTGFSAWMYDQARKAGDRGLAFRFATWFFALSAGANNYWHESPILPGDASPTLTPTPKAVAYGAMSVIGIAVWELYSSLKHRKKLREAGKMPPARPAFGLVRWARFPLMTFTAWSMSIRVRLETVNEAWASALRVDIVARELAPNGNGRSIKARWGWLLIVPIVADSLGTIVAWLERRRRATFKVELEILARRETEPAAARGTARPDRAVAGRPYRATEPLPQGGAALPAVPRQLGSVNGNRASAMAAGTGGRATLTAPVSNRAVTEMRPGAQPAPEDKERTRAIYRRRVAAGETFARDGRRLEDFAKAAGIMIGRTACKKIIAEESGDQESDGEALG